MLCFEEMLDKVEKSLVCFSFVFYDKIVGFVVSEEWCCDGVLLVEVLLEQ